MDKIRLNMKITALLLWGIFHLPLFSFGQGMVFFEGSWAQVLEKAQQENKHVFVDAYTDWCGPCKMMAKNIFPLPEVGSFYNKHFINYKFNMEKGDGKEFAKAFQVGVYPSYLFFNAEGRLLHRTVGYKQGPQFTADGAAALDTTRQLITNIIKYQSGNREPQLLYNLALGLSDAGAPDPGIEEAYLKTQTGEELYSVQNYNFLLTNQAGYRGKAFRLLLEQKQKFAVTAGETEVYAKLSSVLFQALQYAVSNQMPLLKDSILKDINDFPAPYKEKYIAYAELIQLAPSPDREKYFGAIIHYMDTYGTGDIDKINAYASEIVNTREPEKIQKALEWLNHAITIQPNVRSYENLCYAYLISDNKTLAKQHAENGIRLVQNTGEDDSLLRTYLSQAEQP